MIFEIFFPLTRPLRPNLDPLYHTCVGEGGPIELKARSGRVRAFLIAIFLKHIYGTQAASLEWQQLFANLIRLKIDKGLFSFYLK